jgi:hypothetical protein
VAAIVNRQADSENTARRGRGLQYLPHAVLAVSLGTFGEVIYCNHTKDMFQSQGQNSNSNSNSNSNNNNNNNNNNHFH